MKKFSQEEITALNIAKEITIAKLSSSAPSNTNKNIGVEIAEMFAAIYKATLRTITEEDFE